MSHEQELQPYGPYSPPADVVARPGDVAVARKSRLRAVLSVLWQSRVALFGLLSIAFALAGEWLMRQPPAESDGTRQWFTLGTWLLVVGTVLVAPVSWVWDTFPRRKAAEFPPADSAALPVRKHSAPITPAISTPARAQRGAALRVRARRLYDRWIAVRRRIGVWGTVAGLVVAGGMAIALFLLVRADFTSPWAPWLWLAMLAVLVLTFAGVRLRVVERFMPHDPAEPAVEPPVRTAEWVAVALIMLVALLARFVNLDTIPAGPYVDESGRAMVARQIIAGEPVEGLPFSLFGSAWWGVPNLYFWLESVAIRLFGDNLLGVRILHALAGLATVWFVYRLARLAWSPRAALVAAALAAVSDFAIQFSRTAGESTIAILTWVVCFYYLYRGVKLQRPLDFVWSGIAGGLTLYTYGSGKLLPVFVAMAAVYIVVRWRLRGARRFVPLTALLAVAAGLTFMPHATFLMEHKPNAFTQRSSGVAIWEEKHKPALQAQYGTDSWVLALPGQVALTYAAFDVGQERGPFYPTREPVLPVPWAALWVLGTAYWALRAGDVRYAMLGIWVASGLAGAFLSTDTPTLQRAAGMVPALAVVPALFLDRVASGFLPVRYAGHVTWRSRAARWAVAGALAAVVALLGWQALSFYFGTYAPRQMYLNPTVAGRYIEKLDPQTDVVLMYNIPSFLGDPSPTIFLGGKVPRSDFNPSERIPVVAPRGKDVHFLIHPPDSPLLPLLQAYYPGGRATQLMGEGNVPYIMAYEVDAAALAGTQSVVARYGDVVRPEPRIGTYGDDGPGQPPAWVQYPVQAEWRGSFIAPMFARYMVSVQAPAGATLAIDGREMLKVEPGAVESVSAELVLAKGVHDIVLSGTLTGPTDPVVLNWGNGIEMVPVGRRFLWNGPGGVLSGVSYSANQPEWLTAGQYDVAGQLPAMARRDGFISFLSANQNLGWSGNVFTDWRGTLAIPVAGDYVFDAMSNGMTALWIDGRLVAGRDLPVMMPAGFPLTIHLDAGRHEFQLRWRAGGDNSPAELRWLPPGGSWQIMPPSALAPTGGGVWTPAELPTAPGPEMTELYP